MPIANGAEYIESLRGRNIKVYLFGELIGEPVDHPMIRPSINAVAETYDIANSEPEIATSRSSLTGLKVNRFLHVAESAEDLVNQNRMQRKLGQKTVHVFSAVWEWTQSIPCILLPSRLMVNIVLSIMNG